MVLRLANSIVLGITPIISSWNPVLTCPRIGFWQLLRFHCMYSEAMCITLKSSHTPSTHHIKEAIHKLQPQKGKVRHICWIGGTNKGPRPPIHGRSKKQQSTCIGSVKGRWWLAREHWGWWRQQQRGHGWQGQWQWQWGWQATKRARGARSMELATRTACNKECNGNGSKSNHN